MNEITYKINYIPNSDEIRELYEDAGWDSYTKYMPLLMKAIKNSMFIMTAWADMKLVGLIRVIGDGVSVIYIQDILVLKAYQRKGIGTCFINSICKEYASVRQKVLLTDDEPKTRAFYESLSFQSCDKGQLVAFVSFS